MRFQWTNVLLLATVFGAQSVFGAPCRPDGICSRDNIVPSVQDAAVESLAARALLAPHGGVAHPVPKTSRVQDEAPIRLKNWGDDVTEPVPPKPLPNIDTVIKGGR